MHSDDGDVQPPAPPSTAAATTATPTHAATPTAVSGTSPAEPESEADSTESPPTPDSNADPSTSRVRSTGAAALLAALLTAAGFCVAGIIRGTYPFGSVSRSTNDLGAQYIPFYAHLWDILHGQAQGDLFFNWQSGFGVGFWGDVGVVLGSPLSLLVALFPRDQIDLAVFVLTTLKLALAAAAMVVLLRKMRPGPAWLAAALGASYGMCGWAIDDAAYVPMWLDGLIALPMFCLVGEWSLQALTRGGVRRTNRLLSVLVIGLFWFSNFYTAYMATIAGGLVLLARVLTSDLSWFRRLRVLLRHAVSVLLGMALAAPLLIPVFTANSEATTSPSGFFTPLPLDKFLSRLMPLSEGVGASASLYVGTAALLLALTLPFNGSLKVITRVVWTATVVLLAASFLWSPTQKFWHGFDTPNGSQYREAFVLCGVLVIVAWLSSADRAPSPIALGGAAALLVTLALISQDSPFLTSGSVGMLAAAGGLTIAVMLTLWLIRRLGNRGWSGIPVVAAVVLVIVVGVETTLSAVVMDEQRAKFLSASAPAWGPQQTEQRDKIAAASDWPEYRTDPGTRTTPNDPMLLGGQGAGLYSSLLPASLNETLSGLGFGWAGFGRASYALDNPVTNAIFSIGAAMHRDDNLTRADAPPLVTIRPGPAPDVPFTSAYGLQERLLGAQVYDVPAYRGSVVAPGLLTLKARCPVGSTVFLHFPQVGGQARLAGGEWQPLTASRRPRTTTSSKMVELGKVPASGDVLIDLQVVAAVRGAITPRGALGCLDSTKLATAVSDLRAAGATHVETGGRSISATLKPGSTGVAVIAAPALPGWLCARDGGKPEKPTSFGGLLSVSLPGPTERVSCEYLPPGLGIGLAAGGGALLITLGLALAARTRKRQRTSNARP